MLNTLIAFPQTQWNKWFAVIYDRHVIQRVKTFADLELTAVYLSMRNCLKFNKLIYHAERSRLLTSLATVVKRCQRSRGGLKNSQQQIHHSPVEKKKD